MKSIIELKRELESYREDYLPSGANVLKFSQSLCPSCVLEGKFDRMKIDTVIYEMQGKVWQTKKCELHGATTEIYWEDYEMYSRASRYQDRGIEIENPNIYEEVNCPVHCGLCREHKSHTALGNIVLTNRCNLACWYCFFYAKEGDNIYEPAQEQIREMLRNMKQRRPVGANVVQFTGGEPTLRDDLIEIIDIAKEEGYRHIMINTNGIRISQEPRLAEEIKRAGSRNGGSIILYMSFDGVTAGTNPKNYWEVPGALENCRKAGLQIVLVPTVIRGINDHQIGEIVKFASANIDIVRGVNFQPVSLVGRMPREEREKQRITIPGVIRALEEQMQGVVSSEDFFPVPCVSSLTDFVEFISKREKYRLSIHFACGMATYLFKDGRELRPITNFIDVEGFLDFLKGINLKSQTSRTMSAVKTLWNIRKYIYRTPESMNLSRILLNALRRGDYSRLLDFHSNSLFIGMMHFQDPYNYDIERIKKCDIHYATPDGRIIPFCAFNVLPELYRDKIQERYGIPAERWEEMSGKKIGGDRYRRSLSDADRRKIERYYLECIASTGTG